jgi:hypothetical protein
LTVVKLEQPLNVPSGIEVTDCGQFTLVILEHSLNTPLPIVVIDDKSIVAREEQP